MTKKAKLITIISSAVAALALVILTICLVVANSNREKTNQTIISITSGTQVHLVLNANDKVTQAVPLSNEAKGITLSNSITGLKYIDAVQLLVKKNVEAGYINAETDGYTVQVSIGGDKKDYSKLQNEIVNAINSYFDQVGIIAGANVNISENLKQFVTELKPTAQGIDSKTNSQLMSQYTQIWEMVKDIRPSDYSAFFSAYDAEDAEYQRILTENPVAIEQRQAQIDALNVEINALQTEINALPDGEEKTNKQATLDSKIATRSAYYSNIDSLQTQYDRASINFTRNVETARGRYTINKDTYNLGFTSAYSENVNNCKTMLDNHLANFEANKTEVLNKINEYRESIKK